MMQVLIGPNASGKTTFLDVPELVKDIVSDGIDAAVTKRGGSLVDLTHYENANDIEIGIELRLPDELIIQSGGARLDTARYEIKIGIRGEDQIIINENLWIKPQSVKMKRYGLFPIEMSENNDVIHPRSQKGRAPKGWVKIIGKTESGNDYFKSERTGWNSQFRFGNKKSAISNVPEDYEKFPIAIWVRNYFTLGIQTIMLDSKAMRKSSPRIGAREFLPDGSNLPRVLSDFKKNKLYSRWLKHIRSFLGDIVDIDVVSRPEDNSQYLSVIYSTGEVPAWLVSDGTLRLIALTMLPYLDNQNRTYLIEEPENGIHPKAMEAVFQSLSSSKSSQVFIASHSPVILSMAEPVDLLCFAKTISGYTDVISGSDHPQLRDWKGRVSLDVLFASGVLG